MKDELFNSNQEPLWKSRFDFKVAKPAMQIETEQGMYACKW